MDARVPMIISHPKMQSPGLKTYALVESLDLFPTLIELCNLPSPKGLEGISLVPILKNPSAKTLTSLLHNIQGPLIMIANRPNNPHTWGIAFEQKNPLHPMAQLEDW